MPETAAVPTAQSVDRVVNVPVIMKIMQLPAVMFNQVTKHVESPQTHFFDQGVGVPIAIQRQVPRLQTVLKTAKVPTAQSVGRVVDVPVIMQIMPLVHKVIEEPVAKPRQAPLFQKEWKIVERPRSLRIGIVVEAPLTLQINQVSKLAECPTNWTVCCSARR